MGICETLTYICSFLKSYTQKQRAELWSPGQEGIEKMT